MSEDYVVPLDELSQAKAQMLFNQQQFSNLHSTDDTGETLSNLATYSEELSSIEPQMQRKKKKCKEGSREEASGLRHENDTFGQYSSPEYSEYNAGGLNQRKKYEKYLKHNRFPDYSDYDAHNTIKNTGYGSDLVSNFNFTSKGKTPPPALVQKKRAQCDQSLPEESLHKLKIKEPIFDMKGAFSYEINPVEYMKARKRKQNRESAVRSRMRKKGHEDELKERLGLCEKEIQDLKISNSSLLAENNLLKRQLNYFETLLKENHNPPASYNKYESRFELASPSLSSHDFMNNSNISKSSEPLFSDYVDPDMVLYGLDRNSQPISKNLLVLTVVLGIFTVSSIYVNSGNSNSNNQPSGGSNRRLQSIDDSKANSTQFSIFSPYFICFLYFCFCLFLVFRNSSFVKAFSTTFKVAFKRSIHKKHH